MALVPRVTIRLIEAAFVVTLFTSMSSPSTLIWNGVAAGILGIVMSGIVTVVAAAEMPRMAAIEARLGQPLRWSSLPPAGASTEPLTASMSTLCIDAGRQDKLRPGDVLGALTGDAGIAADAVGKIGIFATRAYVAIRRDQAATALKRLRSGKIKGRSFRVRAVD